jgi:hypothetical protein
MGQSERRGSSRPANGDSKRCPQCAGMMEFNERFRFDHGMMPGWVCENPACPVKRFPARHVDTLPAPLRSLVRIANAVSARAFATVSGKRRAS